jgi:UDP-glucose 4-epimerase
MNKKVIVTGGLGFIGSYLVKKLIKKGWKVYIIDSAIRGNVERISDILSEIKLYQLDIRDEESVLSVFKKVKAELVIHLAAINGTENFYQHPQLVLEVGIKGILSIINACQKADVPDLILASSAEVYQEAKIIPTSEDVPLIIPNSLNPRYSYAGSKIISELIAFNYYKEHFRKVQVFRPHNIYGPDMGWKHVIPQLIMQINKLSNSYEVLPITIQGSGNETRAFCYIDDAINGILKMYELGKHREIYNIGNNQEISILKLINFIEDFINVKLKINISPLKQGSVLRRCPDISKISSIGYAPKINIEEGLKRTIKWYLNNSQESLKKSLK